MVLARLFFIPRKTLVSVRPVEKMLEFWQDGTFTVASSVSPFFLFLHKPSVSSGAAFSGHCSKLDAENCKFTLTCSLSLALSVQEHQLF